MNQMIITKTSHRVYRASGCQKELQLGGNIAHVVGFNLHLTCRFRRILDDIGANEFVSLKGVEIHLWGLQLVVKESLHEMSHLVSAILTFS